MDSNITRRIIILYEDPHLMVLSKPSGLLSQGEHTGDENLVDWLRERWGRPYVGLIHRLDRNTSGVMVVAKRSKSAQRLTDSLQSGQLERWYIALLHGNLEKPRTWTHWLLKDPRTNRVQALSHKTSPDSKIATLNVTPLSRGSSEGIPFTLALFKLETGRSHQIRVQASFEGFPLLGDHKYSNLTRAKLSSSHSLDRPALHSFKIQFPHPKGGEIQTFTADLPEDLTKITGPFSSEQILSNTFPQDPQERSEK